MTKKELIHTIIVWIFIIGIPLLPKIANHYFDSNLMELNPTTKKEKTSIEQPLHNTTTNNQKSNKKNYFLAQWMKKQQQ